MIYIMTSKTHCHIVPYTIENKTKQFMVEEATGSEHLIRPQFRIQKITIVLTIWAVLNRAMTHYDPP